MHFLLFLISIASLTGRILGKFHFPSWVGITASSTLSKNDKERKNDKKQSFFANGIVDPDLENYYLPESVIDKRSNSDDRKYSSPSTYASSASSTMSPGSRLPPNSGGMRNQMRYQQENTMTTTSKLPSWLQALPRLHLRFDPLINFKFKQRLVLLGACVTLGLDYLADIAQWRSYCSIEDSWLQGRFSLRGNELGWAKSWMLNLGLGEENMAKLKLRLGWNYKSHRVYAKLRFRTEPLSPFDIGEGLACQGRLPLPLYLLPAFSKGLPLRVEYRLRINTSHQQHSVVSHSSSSGSGSSHKSDKNNKILVSTGLGAIDLSLDELNFCLEFDEKTPVWGIGLVRNDQWRKRFISSADRDVSVGRDAGGSSSGSMGPSGRGGGPANGRGGLGSRLGGAGIRSRGGETRTGMSDHHYYGPW